MRYASLLLIFIIVLSSCSFLGIKEKEDKPVMPKPQADATVGEEKDIDDGTEDITDRADVGLESSKEEKAISKPITIIAGGDVSQYRVGNTEYPHPPLERSLSSGLSEEIMGSDIFIFNLETPVCEPKVAPDFGPSGTYVFRTSPDSLDAFSPIQDSGTRIVAVLANNHAMNFGAGCLADTITSLDERGIVASGAGRDLDEARALKVVEVQGVRVGFLSYAERHVYESTELVPDIWVAGPEKSIVKSPDLKKAGVAATRLDDLTGDEGYPFDDIAKASGQVDFLVVSMHSGEEYKLEPTQRQVDFAKKAIDSGADIIIGHHPHVIQPISMYEGKYIIWSLGNLISDQAYPAEVKHNLLLRIHVEGGDVQGIDRIYFYSKSLQIPTPADDDKIAAMDTRLDSHVELA